jgi:hypothetical protein
MKKRLAAASNSRSESNGAIMRGGVASGFGLRASMRYDVTVPSLDGA